MGTDINYIALGGLLKMTGLSSRVVAVWQGSLQA
jgi:hypothetical protein